MLLWLDIETTGLDPVEDGILEIAAIATTDNLDAFERFEIVTNQARASRLIELDPVVQTMHTKGGTESLWCRSIASGVGMVAVIEQWRAWLAKCREIATKNGEPEKPVLAGSTVHFDRSFMFAHGLLSEGDVSHRHLDVSTLNEIGRRFWRPMYDARPKGDAAHRALADIEQSISVFRHYLANLDPKAVEPPLSASWPEGVPVLTPEALAGRKLVRGRDRGWHTASAFYSAGLESGGASDGWHFESGGYAGYNRSVWYLVDAGEQ